jgi:hypothetical protein
MKSHLFLTSVAILSLTATLSFSQTPSVSSPNENITTVDQLNSSLKKLNNKLGPIDQNIIIDSIGDIQSSDDKNLKQAAYNSLVAIAKDQRYAIDIRRSAVLQAINTLNAQPSTLPALDLAVKEKLIDSDKYYGLLANYFPDASDELKLQILKNLESSKNEYGKHVLLTQNRELSSISNLSEKVAISLSQFIDKNPPILNRKNSSVNIIDFNAMQSYIDTYSNIKSITENIRPEDAAAELVTRKQTDARYLVAYTLSKHYDNSFLSKKPTSSVQSDFRAKLTNLAELQRSEGVAKDDMFLPKAIEKLNQ